MNDEIKRRAFLTGIVGFLVGVPVAVRLFSGGGKNHGVETARFTTQLKKYRSMIDVPVRDVEGPSTFALPLAPPVGEQRRYVLFAPTQMPSNLSRAVGDDPDTFVVREGTLFIDRTSKGQTVLTGGDSVFQIVSPMGTEEREGQQITILQKDGQLRMAKTRNISSEYVADIQFPHLLSLQNPPKGNLKPGQTWKGSPGRIRPFAGFMTHYEIAGFSEVADRKTVSIAFSGETPNVVGMPGVNSERPGKKETMTSKHRGHAWFDLETGLLVRQETDIETVSGGLDYMTKGNKNEPYSLSVKSQFIVQLFNV